MDENRLLVKIARLYYKAIHMIRKGQVQWVSGTDVQRHIQFIKKIFQLAT